MPEPSQIHALSYLQDMPTDRAFLVKELPYSITGGELCKLRYDKYIEACGATLERGHKINIWKVTTAGKKLIAKQTSRLPSRLRRERVHRPCLITAKRRATKDEFEVAAYLSKHPDAKMFDVALECHLGDSHARRLMRLVKDQRCHGLVPL